MSDTCFHKLLEPKPMPGIATENTDSLVPLHAPLCCYSILNVVSNVSLMRIRRCTLKSPLYVEQSSDKRASGQVHLLRWVTAMIHGQTNNWSRRTVSRGLPRMRTTTRPHNVSYNSLYRRLSSLRFAYHGCVCVYQLRNCAKWRR